MDPLFATKPELAISSDSIRNYVQLAHKHLNKHDSTVNVEKAGTDESGRSIFGICMRSYDGDEEWYDPADQSEDTIAGWFDKDEAQNVLDTKVLPNLGYAIYQRDLQLFHKNMTHE